MPISYIPFEPQVLQGQAILDNFSRTRRVLRYRDNDNVFRTLDRGMPLYETTLIEKVEGKNPTDKNLVLRGECISACAYLKSQNIKIDLVYIDPPFASGADYAKKIHLRKNPKVAQSIAAAEQELDLEELRAFEEKMYGDIWNKEQYLNWMYENLLAIKSVMSDTASIYVHLDWHIGHYVKILMDEVFGEGNFQNEVIWKRTTSRAGSSYINHIHDVIFFYTKSDNTTWNKQYTAYSKDAFPEVDANGKRWHSTPLTGPGLRNGTSGKAWRGFDPNNMGKGRHWVIPSYVRKNLSEKAKVDTQQALDELDDLGRITWGKNGNSIPNFKQYIDDLLGIELQSIWTDISVEETEYATQKPESLLERIIKASSDEDMTVADFFGGSGVTAAVANKLGRNFIHNDIGINSIQTVRDRLKAQGAGFSQLEIEDGVSLYRNPSQTMHLLKSKILHLRNEDPLPAFFEGEIIDSKYGAIPVYLPNLQDHTTRLLNKYWISRLISEAMSDLDQTKYKRVRLFYIDIEDQKELLAFIKDNNMTGIEIELADLKPLLAETRLEDDALFKYEKTENDTWRVTIEMFKSERLSARIKGFNDKGMAQNLKAQLTDNQEDSEETEEKTPKKRSTFKPITISDEGLELIEFLSLDCTQSEGAWQSDHELKIDKLGYVVREGIKTKDFWNATISSEKQPLRLKIRNISGDETVFAVRSIAD